MLSSVGETRSWFRWSDSGFAARSAAAAAGKEPAPLTKEGPVGPRPAW